jgi:hypothetical protein
MASLEPPIPASAAPVFESSLGHIAPTQEQDAHGWNVKASRWAKWRRSVGLLLLFVTVFLWTVSNFLASVRKSPNPLRHILRDERLIICSRRSSRTTPTANRTSSPTSTRPSSSSPSYQSWSARPETNRRTSKDGGPSATTGCDTDTLPSDLCWANRRTRSMRASRSTTKDLQAQERSY